MKLTITGYSTALFSTWFFVEELGLLFDAGDGVVAGLLQKSRKIKNVFISHADRDHIMGLLQFNQLNARNGLPTVHYPADCGSFPYLEAFSKKFDPHVEGMAWNPMKANEQISIKEDIFIQTIKNTHIPADESITKSLSFKVFQSKRKLKPEFLQLKGLEIKQLIEEKGRDHVTESVENCLLGYSGDTLVEDYERWDNTPVLIHEATFLGGDESHRHSTLEEVLKMVSEIKVEKLILSHFSSRYAKEEIDQHIRLLCKEYRVQIPIFRIAPGEVARNILEGEVVNG